MSELNSAPAQNNAIETPAQVEPSNVVVENEASATPLNSADDIVTALGSIDAAAQSQAEPQEQGELDETQTDTQDDAQPQPDEPAQPAIDAPASWGKDQKELFSKLPRELQVEVQRRELERERFVNAKSDEAKAAERAKLEALQQTGQTAQFVLQAAQNVVEAEFADINWAALQRQNPAQYEQLAALRGQRLQYVEQLQQAAQHAAAQAAQAHQQEVERKLKEELPTIKREITEIMGDGYNTQSFASDAAAFLKSMGAPESHINSIGDAYIVKLIAKAMKYDQMQKTAASAKQKVAEAPAVMKQKSNATASPDKARYERALNNFKRDNRSTDALAALLNATPR